MGIRDGHEKEMKNFFLIVSKLDEVSLRVANVYAMTITSCAGPCNGLPNVQTGRLETATEIGEVGARDGETDVGGRGRRGEGVFLF